MAVRGKLTVVDKDLGYKKWVAEMKKVAKNKPHVQLGVFGGDKDGEPSELLIIALTHEFGSEKKGIPSRSWLRGGIDAYEAQWQVLRLNLVRAVDAGKLTVEQALHILGQQAVADIKTHIRARIPPPLKPATIARKGSDLPLVDSGQFINSITYRVVMGGKRG